MCDSARASAITRHLSVISILPDCNSSPPVMCCAVAFRLARPPGGPSIDRIQHPPGQSAGRRTVATTTTSTTALPLPEVVRPASAAAAPCRDCSVPPPERGLRPPPCRMPQALPRARRPSLPRPIRGRPPQPASWHVPVSAACAPSPTCTALPSLPRATLTTARHCRPLPPDLGRLHQPTR